MPALIFTAIYILLQSAFGIVCSHLAASGPAPLKAFVLKRPGLILAAEIVLPMAAALLAVFPEGRRRLCAFRKRKACGAEERGGEREALLLVLLAVAACAFCVFGNALIQAMGLNPDSVSAMQPIYNEIPFLLLLLFFAGFTPFAEEFVFRGLVYTGLRRRFPPLLSVLASAACFGLYHGELIQGIYAFCMGLLLGLSMERSGDIRMPWLLHGLANGLPLCLSRFGLWEPAAGPAGRACALTFLLISAGLYWGFSARERERK
jgi:membrane protease YdiL (CAAX protease family)